MSEDFLTNPEVKEALEYIEMGHFTEAELEAYDKYWDTIATERTLHADFMEKGLTEGRKLGLEQGLEQGRSEGIKEGMKEGKKEGIKQVALNLLQSGMTPKQVSEMTGLSIDEVEILPKK